MTGIQAKDDQAVAVRLAGGAIHHRERVISAAGGPTAILDMLGGEHLVDEIRGCYNEQPALPPLIHVALGAARSAG